MKANGVDAISMTGKRCMLKRCTIVNLDTKGEHHFWLFFPQRKQLTSIVLLVPELIILPELNCKLDTGVVYVSVSNTEPVRRSQIYN